MNYMVHEILKLWSMITDDVKEALLKHLNEELENKELKDYE